MTQKIVKLTADNYMRLSAVEITPDGNVVILGGKNGGGKSDVLSSIMATLGGKKYHPDKPIREGADSAEVKIVTENWIIKRTFTAGGDSKVTVTNADGLTTTTPQKLLDKIVGEIAFDPTEFASMGKTEAGKKQQRTLLMNMVGLDFTDIEQDIADVKEKRSGVRTAKETYEHQAKEIVLSSAEDLPDEEVSIMDLTAKLKEANDRNAEDGKIQTRMAELRVVISNHATAINQNEDQIKALERQMAHCKKTLSVNGNTKAGLEVELTEMAKLVANPIDTEPIIQKIDWVEAENRLIRNRKQHTDLMAKASAKATEYQTLGKQMKELENQKAKRLAEVKMPVEGLSVTEDGVIYYGIPLSQEGGAKKLEISFAVAMQKNPELRVILMNGNELDDDSLKIICELAEKYGYQVWIERWAGGEGGIIIEDGSVKQS